MSFITLDMETYYGDGLGFKTQTNEEYLRDPRFEVIGISIKIDDGETYWISGTHEELKAHLLTLPWSESALLAHNTMFDGAILAWHFGIVPAFYYDTLCMARAIHGVEAGGSLAALAGFYALGKKGTEVVNAYGKRREDFTPEELSAYGDYCCNDVELTYKLFHHLHTPSVMTDNPRMIALQYKYLGECGRPKQFSDDEYRLIDLTLRMYIQPTLQLDDALLVERLEEIRAEKETLLSGLKGLLGVETTEEVRKKLASNKQFAEILTDMDVEVPVKLSPTTGKFIFALAKNDEGFLALLEHPWPVVQQLCSVRLGTKSTIEESRIETFIGIGGRNKGLLPIPLKYFGAHTGRWAGLDAVNLQNLPSRDKKKKTLKNSLVAPPGYVLINSDSSQIEARKLSWLAGQDDLTAQFARGEDVYSSFASEIFNFSVSKANPVERFVGKTCILGLGYMTGAVKLQHTLKVQPPGADLTLEECRRIVELYRLKNYRIVEFWNACGRALTNLVAWPDGLKPYWLGNVEGVVQVTPEGLRLPNGLYIRYPNLRVQSGPNQYSEIIYDSRRGPKRIWAGGCAENIIQALARIVVGEQMLKISERYRVALTVHDAALVVVPEAERDAAMAFVSEVMSTPPAWAPGLPVACEAKSGRSYGECG